MSAAVAALSLVPLVPPLRHAVEGVAEGLTLRTRSRALAALAVAVVFALASAVPDDVWAAVVALGVGLTSFALPVWCHWRVERPRGDPRQLCKSLRFVLLEIVLPAVVLFLGVALSVLPAAGLVARTALSVVPAHEGRRLGTAMDDSTIRTAVDAWFADATAAEAAYGHISDVGDWGVTDMAFLNLFIEQWGCTRHVASFNEETSARGIGFWRHNVQGCSTKPRPSTRTSAGAGCQRGQNSFDDRCSSRRIVALMWDIGGWASSHVKSWSTGKSMGHQSLSDAGQVGWCVADSTWELGGDGSIRCTINK